MNINELLEDVLEETGAQLSVSKDDLVQYTAERGAHLATIVDEPGFSLALRAERDSIALYAGLNASLAAEAADARMVGTIQGVLLKLAMVAV